MPFLIFNKRARLYRRLEFKIDKGIWICRILQVEKIGD
ncbi:hypothetical protein LKF67_2253 [Lactococcus lactis subsp. lactis]|nr:hypothetical protein LKF67_2253 [Lactococcus lactis subsp. lactis]